MDLTAHTHLPAPFRWDGWTHTWEHRCEDCGVTMNADVLTITGEMRCVAAYVTHPAQTPKAQRAARRQLLGMVADANPHADGDTVAAAVRALVRA